MSQENPCLKCSIDQGCCTHLSGLRVNQAEFDRCFASHQDKLSIEREGPLFKISVHDGGACPNWKDQCAVYEDRPMECRLFPHTIGSVFDGETLLLTVHKRTDCPLKKELAMGDQAAVEMVEQFARETVGPERAYRVVLDAGATRLKVLARQVLRKLT